MSKFVSKYTDSELLDWIQKGDDGNVRDNLEAIDYQILHCDRWDIREAISKCLDFTNERIKNENP